MTKPVYEIIENESDNQTIKRTDPNGEIWFIPCNEANSDYQAYLASLEDETISK